MNIQTQGINYMKLLSKVMGKVIQGKVAKDIKRHPNVLAPILGEWYKNLIPPYQYQW